MDLPKFDPEFAALSPPTQGYLLGAALVSRFRPERLTPLDPSALTVIAPSDKDRSAGLSYVIRNSRACELEDPAQFSLTLDDDLRRQVLDGMGSLDAIQAALRNLPIENASEEPLMAFFDADRAAETLSLAELSTRRQGLVWLRSYLDNDERLHELDRHIERVALVAPLQRLAGDAFVGRTEELRFLRRFVGVLPEERADQTFVRRLGAAVGSAIGGVSDWVTTIFRDSDVMLVTAPGGMGKSALLAELVLEHCNAPPEFRTPFVYLDFDRPSLISRDLQVFLEEIGRQISIQTGIAITATGAGAFNPGAGFVPAAAQALEAIEASDVDRAYFLGRQGDAYVDSLAEALRASSFAGKPLLLVFDTLERVFRRGRHWVAALDDLIGSLRSAGIDVRVVAAGRAFLAEQQANNSLGSRALRWREHALRELPTDMAEALLKRKGVPPDQAALVVQQIGGVPLSLHLAADFLRKPKSDAAALGGLTRSWLFKRRLGNAVIQGNLYQRILTHIEDEKVQQLACPGLILREVTPRLIMEVLAEPCGLGVISEDQARHLFAELAKEFTLVDEVGKDRLKHRSDVRQVMLSQMLTRDADRARRISEAAVRYFDGFTDPKSIAEGLYHRMLLDEDRNLIEQRWVDGVEDYLGEEIVDEIPSIPMRVYAAGKLNLEIRDAEWAREADMDTWERKITQDVNERLKLGQVREALQLVAGKVEFSAGSPLYPLVAQAHADLRDFATAVLWIEAGLERVESATTPAGRQTLVALYLVRARMFDQFVALVGAAKGFAAAEVQLLDALWEEYKPDTRVILIALLELEALQQIDSDGTVELRRWLEHKVTMVRAEGAAIEPPVALRVLPALVLGTEERSLDVARWLVDLPGVRSTLGPLLQRFLSRSLTFNGILTSDLHARVLGVEEQPADTDEQRGAGPERRALTVQEIEALAQAIRLSAQETRIELRTAKR